MKPASVADAIREASHEAKIATAWACEVVKRAGWTLKADGPGAWEALKDGRCLVVSDWRDLCRFAKEVQS